MAVRFIKEYSGRATLDEFYDEGKVGFFTEEAEAFLVDKGVAVHVNIPKPEPEIEQPKQTKRGYKRRK